MKGKKMNYFSKFGFVIIHIIMKPVRFIFLTGGVLTPPWPTPLKDCLLVGLIGILAF